MKRVEARTRTVDESGARREKILDAARSLFATYGYHGTSIRQLHRGTDSADGLLYYYFESKLDLLRAVLEVGFQEMASRRLADDIEPGASVPDAMRRSGRRLWERWNEHADVMRIVLRDYQVLAEAGEYSLPAAFVRSSQGLSDFLRHAIERGEMRQIDPVFAVRSFICTLLGFYQFQVVLGGEHVEKIEFESFLEGVIDSTWRGWKVDKRRAR